MLTVFQVMVDKTALMLETILYAGGRFGALSQKWVEFVNQFIGAYNQSIAEGAELASGATPATEVEEHLSVFREFVESSLNLDGFEPLDDQ
jgi:hypothetical protein